MSILSRIAKAFLRSGEQFTVGSNTYRGVFSILSTGTMRNYLDDPEVLAITHPALMLTTQGDAVIAVNDTITRDGVTYTVLRVSNHRLAGVLAVKIAILA